MSKQVSYAGIAGLFTSWGESLAIFKPKNLKLFFLVTVNAWLKTVSLLITLLWPLLVVIVGVGIVANYVAAYHIPLNLGLAMIIASSILWWPLLYFCICALVRPSVEQKSVPYIVAQLKKMAFVIPFLFLWTVLVLIGLYVGPLMRDFNFKIVGRALLIIGIFFGLDYRGSFLVFWRALDMYLYNMPFFVISSVGWYGLDKIVEKIELSIVTLSGNYSFIVSVIVNVMWMFFLLFYMLFILCWFNNFYLKRAHEQQALYR